MENLSEEVLESHIVYIKPFTQGDNHGFALHSSTGKPLGFFESYDSAFCAAKLHDLAPVSVH